MPSSAFRSLHVLDVDYTYLDSGPPSSSSNYTTWAFVHGMGFNGAVFEKLLPLAHAHNLRIVSIYRRGYSPSSGFRDAELAGIGLGKKAGPFLRAQGTEIATFLANFATEQRIPVADPNNPNVGGVVLIGWSLGIIHVRAVLAHFDDLPEDTQSTLRKYLHTILFHDAVPAGIPDVPEYGISGSSEAENHKRFDGFFCWTTAHFVHKSITSENPDDLEFSNPSEEIPRSLHALSYAQRAEYTDLQAYSPAGCDGKLVFCDVTAFATLTKRAFFDKARAAKSPHVKVRFMTGGASVGVFIWAMWIFRKHVENPPKELYGSDAETARDIKFVTHPEGNHFIFWEDPEKAIQQYSIAINL